MRANGSLFGYGLAAMLLAMTSVLDAATCEWVVDGPGNWGTPANWTGCGTGNGDPAGTPGPADIAVIPAGTSNAQVALGQDRTVAELHLQGGTLVGGGGNLTITTQWLWDAPSAIQGVGLSASVTLDSIAVATWSAPTMEMRNWKIVNFGSINWTQGELRFLTGSELENRGSLNISTSLPGDIIRTFSDGAPQNRFHHVAGSNPLSINGPGTVIITGGATTNFFDNGSTVDITGGLLDISAGGGDFGTYNIAASAALRMFGDPIGGRILTGTPAVAGSGLLRAGSINGVTISGSVTHTGPLEVIGLLRYQTGATVSLSQLTLQTGGTLTGSDTFELSGTANWNGGTISGDSPGLPFTILPGALMTVGLDDARPNAILDRRTLVNQNELRLVAGGTGQRNMTLDGGATIDNQGLLVIDSNPSSAHLVIPCLSPSPGCGFVQSAAPAEIQVDGQPGGLPNRFTSDIALTLDGPLSVVSGEFDLEAQLSLGSQVGIFLGDGGSTPGLLRRAAGPLDLGAGLLAGRGTVIADVSVSGGTIDPTRDGFFPGRLAIQGNLTATATLFPMILDGNSPPPGPEGLITGFHDQLVISGSADLDGTVDVSLGLVFTPTSGETYDLITFASRTGTGTLALGTNPDPAFSLIEEPTRVRYAEAPVGPVTCTWNPAGAGADVWSNPAKWDNCGAAVGPPAGTPGPSESAIINGGIVGLDFDVTVDGLTLNGGDISGDNDLAIQTAFDWTGGRMSASNNAHRTVLGSVATVNFSGGQKTLDDRTLVIDGAVNWTTGLIELANNGRIEIGATGILFSTPAGPPETIFPSGSGSPEIVNNGQIVKQGTDTSGLGAMNYSGNGNIDVNDGTFLIESPGSFGGAINVASGAVLELRTNDRSFAVGSSISGPGLIRFGLPSGFGPNGNQRSPSGTIGGRNVVLGGFTPTGQVVLQGAALVLGETNPRPEGASPPISIGSLRIDDSGAVLDGDAELTITGSLEWLSGVITGTDPTHIVRVAPLATATFGQPTNGGARLLANRHFINEGAITWSAGTPLGIDDGALFENRGTLVVNLTQGTFADFTSNNVGSPRVWNTPSGVIQGVALTEQYMSPLFDNDGTYELQSGQLFLLNGGIDSGSYLLAAGSRMVLDASLRTLTSTGSITGGGELELSFGSDYTIQGTFSPAFVTVGEPFGGRSTERLRVVRTDQPSGGASVLRLDSGGPTALANLQILETGILASASEVSVSNDLAWLGGVVDVGTVPLTLEGGTSAMRVLSGATATLGDPVNPLMRLDGWLRIEGSVSWLGGTIQVDNAALVEVESGGVLQATGTNALTCGDGMFPCSSLRLAVRGGLRRSGAGNTLLEPTQPVLVDGQLVALGGSLQVSGAELRSQGSGAMTVNPGASLDVSGGIFLDGGVLRGGGQVNGDLTNIAGTLAPGTLLILRTPEGSVMPDVLSINGNYVQQAGGTLEINIGGFTAGGSADRLAVSGSADLGGTLVLIDDGFVPTPPDSYDFLTAGAAVSLTFDTEVQPFAGYQVEYGPNAVTLGPAPVALVVNSTADPGDGVCDVSECTLRDAILAANGNGGPDVIEFAIPAGQCTGPGGACTIAPAVPFPDLFDSVIIDGYTQPGAAPSTTGPGSGQGSNATLLIEIDGNLLSGSPCLTMNGMASSSAVLGIATFGCGSGIQTQGGSDNQYVIAGNFLGLRADGSAAPAGQQVGVSVQGGVTRVGDGTPAGVNVIAGNLQQGISVNSTISGGPVEISGNLIGTAPDGITARPNALAGIAVSTNLALPVLIGGPLPDDRNIIAGNTQDGIRFDCPLSNGACFDGSFVIGNWIGLAVDLSPLGNGGNGVNVSTMASGLLVVGGVLPGEPNRIAHNAGNGVLATHADLGRLTISGNEILLNGGLGIDLGGDGRTANDPGDGDTGPNSLQNFPTVTAYTLAPSGDSASITVEIDTPSITGNYPMTVDFYKAEGDEPAVLLGSTSCPSPNTPCNAALSFPVSVLLAPQDTLVAIATDGNGKSSEASFYTTTTTVEAGPDVPLGAQYAVQVTVTSAAPFVPLGAVDVTDDQMGSCVAPLVASGANVATGSCLLTAVAPTGIRSITGTYQPGEAAFVTSEGTDSLGVIGLLPTTTSITGITPAVSVVGQPYRVSVDVDDGKFSVGLGQVEVRQLNDGQTCVIDLAVGNFCDLVGTAALNTAVQARFLGEGFLAPSNSAIVPHAVERADTTITILEDTPDPSLPGQAITVRFNVDAVAPGGGTPGGEVLITDGSASCGVTLPSTTCTFVPKSTGSFVIEARYLGDANYNASTATTPHQVIASGADLGITKRNGLRIVPAGQPSSYVILVTNAGPEAVVGARVVDLLPPELSAASWTCTATGPATCPASGSGNIDALVNLEVDASVTFVLTVTAQPVPEAMVTNTATVATPTGVTDPQPANNSSSDTDPIGLFGDGLETESE